MKYIDSEKLIAEIERMREINRKAFEAERIESGIFHGRAQAINHLFEFITSLQQELPSLPSNLDEAADTYSENILANGEDMFDAIADGFKAGAEWMAGQGYTKEETVYFERLCDENRIMVDLGWGEPERGGFNPGDKVVVQIRKK